MGKPFNESKIQNLFNLSNPNLLYVNMKFCSEPQNLRNKLLYMNTIYENRLFISLNMRCIILWWRTSVFRHWHWKEYMFLSSLIYFKTIFYAHMSSWTGRFSFKFGVKLQNWDTDGCHISITELSFWRIQKKRRKFLSKNGKINF